MKKCYVLFLIIVFNSAFAVPDVDDSAVLGNDATCDETSLDITDLSADLHAEWEPNTINLTYYNDDTQYGDAYSCQYDDFVQIPELQPSKHGYDFAGWQVRTAVQSCLSQQYVVAMNNGVPNYDPQYVKWEPIAQNGYTMAEAFEDENLISGLSAGEWSVIFPNGELRGHAVCTNIAPNNLNNLINVDSQTLVLALYGDNGSGIIPYATFNKNDNTGGYCWCAGTDFGNSCSVTPSSWVFGISNSDSMSMSKDECMSECSGICVLELVGFNIIAYRRAIFDVAGE